MKVQLKLFAALWIILLTVSCSSVRSRVPTEMQVTKDLLAREDPRDRQIRNPYFVLEILNIRRIEISNLRTGEKRLIELDWPLTQIHMCPSCSYASLLYIASTGTPYSGLIDLNTGDLITHLGPNEYLWSERGLFMGMGYAQKIEILKADLFDSYLEAEDDDKRTHLLHRMIEVSPNSGKEVSILGFYEDWVMFFNLGCCGSERVFGVDLEESQISWIPCRGSECKDLDDLGEIFGRVKNQPKYRPQPDLFKLVP